MNLNQELQELFDGFYEEARRKYRTQLNAGAVEMMKQYLGRRIISAEDFSGMRYFWPYYKAKEVDKALWAAPCFLGTGSGSGFRYCLLRDAVKAVSHIRRPVCWYCGARYRKPENAEDDRWPYLSWQQKVWGECPRTAWSEWSSCIYVEGKGFRSRMFDYPTCSGQCYKKAHGRIAREIVWLKTARLKQMEVRRYLRNNHAA